MAFTVLSRIEDVLYADFATQNPSQAALMRNSLRCTSFSATDRLITPLDETERPSSVEGMTLLDFMGWGLGSDQAENEGKKEPEEVAAEPVKDDEKFTTPKGPKLTHIVTSKRVSYLENLGGLRSPTARH